MKAIHVLRKPCSEPTVAANVLRHGCGAINVDGCRVDGTPGDGRWGKGVQTPDRHPFSSGVKPYIPIDKTSGGRWPANVVFQHLEGCRQTGVRKVKGDGRAGDMAKSEGGSGGIWAKSTGTPAGALYGTETVPLYECASGCPVAALDAQSGQTSTTGAPERGQQTPLARGGFPLPLSGRTNAKHTEYPGDTGGASRFFKQFVGKRPVGEDR